MSVSLLISNPINEQESNFNVPISTEKVFQDYWMPIIEELDLKWVRCFQSGIELEKEDLEFVLKDLAKMQNWINEYMNSERGGQLIERLENLCKELVDISNDSRSDVKVYIG